MPANHPNPRPASVGLLMLLVVGALLIPGVSAETILNETLVEYADTSVSSEQPGNSQQYNYKQNIDGIYFKNIELYDNVAYITVDIAGNKHEEGRFEASYTLGPYTGTAAIYVSHTTNIFGDVIHTRFVIYPRNWNNAGLINAQTLTFSDFVLYSIDGRDEPKLASFDPTVCVATGGSFVSTRSDKATVSVASVSIWTNQILVNHDNIDRMYEIILTRNLEGISYPSTLTLKNNDLVVYTNMGTVDRQIFYPDDSVTDIIINSGVKDYIFSLTSTPGGPGDPDESDVTVYVRNSQTGALLADAHILVKDTTTDPWTEVVNQTLPSGYDTIYLAKDPGFHPTQYHISATVPGYQQVVPALFFRVTGPTNVVVEMEPLEGGPVDENNTFLEFYVRDLNANGIANAQVFVDGQLRWTNAAGYTQFEVAKNASYPYSVSKSGYVTIEGTATVADGPRYVVNVVLGPKEIPTNPPATDPGGPGATPTPDRRTNEEKGQAVIDMLADNAEGLGALALICLMFGLLKLMVKW